ncbi:3-hydroxyacyl-CoA dehydrogenase [Auraticoccus sp. F435]|uniref:3-hydroxyacyl-CoA dehydrogenase n=1 Tax=Auraticoccus cholistanensis TaxID=2656650 RepID=A0A6A9UWY8_9ACTN|nr:3-hydroxyacyl-CoA dehydrogenase [Auraticoccus cholistanensis]
MDRAAGLAGEDEVVTRALSRDVRLPHGAGTAVLITLDNGLDHTRPNTLGPRSLGELNRALDAALARDDVAAVAITGKPFILAAGADLSQVSKLTSPEHATAIARIGHGVYAKLADARVPTFCFVNGLALGGGLEIALSCSYRTVSASAAAVALPEVFLGLVPGWGGAWLLPNLVGPETAVTVVVENPLNQNRMLKGHQLQGMGLADATFEAADFLERSLDWAARVVRGEVVVERPEHDRGEAWDAAVARGRALADAKVHGTAPAPYAALELIDAARRRTRDEGFAAEDEALTRLIMSEELRAGLYAFDLVQKRAKRPAGAPDRKLARPVTAVGVVGAGLMASQLALLLVRKLQVPVVMSDLDAERARKGVASVHAELEKLHARGRLSADRLNRYKALVRPTTDHADFADCSFVIEAVFEEIGVKKQVFAELEQHVGPETVLATNTSSLSVSEMAADLQHPGRVVGFHFFNPVAVLPLLEVVKGERTDDPTLATAFAVAKELGKNAVLVRDTRGFVVNRVLIRLMGEITRAMDEGTPPEVADRAADPLGLPMSPFVLLQLVGPAVALHVAEVLHAEFGDRFHVSQSVRNLVDAGRPGLYDWGPDGKPYVSDETRALLVTGDRPSTAEQLRERVETALAEEIGLMLAEGVVAAPMDVDLCLVLGAGWPFHDGGITPYLDRNGVSERVNGRRFLPPGVASLPR